MNFSPRCSGKPLPLWYGVPYAVMVLNQSGRCFINPLPISIISYPDMIHIEVNPTLEQVTGYKRGELIGRSSHDVGFYVKEGDYTESNEKLQKDGRLCDYEIPFSIYTYWSRNKVI